MPVLEWDTIIPLIMLSVIWSQTISQTIQLKQWMQHKMKRNEMKWNETKRNEIIKILLHELFNTNSASAGYKMHKEPTRADLFKKIHFNIRMTNTEWNRLQCDWIFYVQLFGVVGCCNYSYCLFSLCMSIEWLRMRQHQVPLHYIYSLQFISSMTSYDFESTISQTFATYLKSVCILYNYLHVLAAARSVFSRVTNSRLSHFCFFFQLQKSKRLHHAITSTFAAHSIRDEIQE